ncbi:Reverse transcriptase domain - like 10 [Theobroma cacao]|nr:Reverse transcriptase domain - like 10 [Theobroma cacao]
MNEDLCADISLEKVRIALFQMHPTKAPGPNGLPVLCYQRFWPLLSRDVHKFVVDFLEGRLWSTEVNHTHITLIPKVPQPDQGSQFRPISLCNVIYKIASKVLANRLKSILPVIISANQSPFVLGRLILDNGIVAHEVIHYLHNKRVGKVGNFALKLDMSKAYDRVEWIFMEVLINSDLGAKFVPSRGIRQGDPFSPFLFVIITEALSGMLTLAKNKKSISGLTVCRQGSNITHLFFANDSMIFGKAQIQEVFKRVSNWKSKVLSIVGREVLIKAVAQAIPIYVMSCFKLPDTLCAEIDSVYARYFPNVNFCEALIGSNPSYLWRSLRESQVKRDNWIPYETLRKVLVCDASVSESMTVSEFIDLQLMR